MIAHNRSLFIRKRNSMLRRAFTELANKKRISSADVEWAKSNIELAVENDGLTLIKIGSMKKGERIPRFQELYRIKQI